MSQITSLTFLQGIGQALGLRDVYVLGNVLVADAPRKKTVILSGDAIKTCLSGFNETAVHRFLRDLEGGGLANMRYHDPRWTEKPEREAVKPVEPALQKSGASQPAAVIAPLLLLPPQAIRCPTDEVFLTKSSVPVNRLTEISKHHFEYAIHLCTQGHPDQPVFLVAGPGCERKGVIRDRLKLTRNRPPYLPALLIEYDPPRKLRIIKTYEVTDPNSRKLLDIVRQYRLWGIEFLEF